MLRNYFIITLRNLLRHKVYALINILGLTFGLACAILLYLYVRDELSYDTHFKNYDHIYRLTAQFKFQSKEDYPAATPGTLAPVMKQDFPEVVRAVRFSPVGKTLLTHNPTDKKINQREVVYADEDYFEVLEAEFLAGDRRTALKKPNTMLLTESVARKFFDSPREALGKSLRINEQEKSFEITGVIRDIPLNSSFRAAVFLSMNTLPKTHPILGFWGNMSCFTFVLLKENTDWKALDKKIKPIFTKYAAKELEGFDLTGHFNLQPLKQVHLNSQNLNFDSGDRGSWSYVYIFSAIALFVLLIAGINYMNLATARSLARAKEVGIRKVLGSYRRQLMAQFLVEAVLVSVLSLILALSLVELVLPYFNQIAGKAVRMNYLENPTTLCMLLGMIVGVGLLSGLYPAFFLSGFNPVTVLKGKFARHRQSALLRKALVVVQFAISIVMIIGTWLVYKQLQYVNSKNLGFNQNQVLVLEVEGETATKYKTLKEKLRQIPQIKAVAAATAVPGTGDYNTQGVLIEQDGEMKEWLVNTFFVDYDYLGVMGIKLTQGRNFSKATPTDTTKSVLVNETLVKRLAWRDKIALGKRLINMNDVGPNNLKDVKTLPGSKIIGVFQDFHIRSLHQAIEPMAVYLTRDRDFYYPNRFIISLQPQNVKETMAKIQEVYENFDKKRPFETYFLDQNFARQYETDQKRMTIFFSFSIFTILIACLGLFGLASFTAEQRTKEIGIRKVLGADISGLLYLITKDFLQLVLVANVLAFPVAYWVMNNWLQNFAYRTKLYENWLVFLLSGFVAFLIAVLTVSYQAYRAATVNPVKVLKDE